MWIVKKSLPRRRFLRGIGATIALPLLDAMVPALTPIARTAAAPTRRLGFIYTPNGIIKKAWVPAGEGGSGFAFSPSLKAIEPFREHLTVVTGLAHQQAASLGDSPGPHSRASAAWLTGTHCKQTEGADVRSGISADQIAAEALGRLTPLPSLEISTEQNEMLIGNCESGYSCIYQNTISWRNPTTPMPMEVHPRVVFTRLFGDGTTPAEQLAHLRTDHSILDAVLGDLAALEKSLGAGDRSRLDQYLDSVREIESRIQRAESRTADPLLELPERPADIPSEYEDHVKLMFDLQTAAYQADITRIITFQLGREVSPRSFPNIGVSGGHHAISHYGNDPVKVEQKTKIDTYQTTLLAYYAGKLRNTPDGDGSLLDHVVVLYGAGLGDPNAHDPWDLGSVVLGGGAGTLKGGRHLKFEPRSYVPMANLLISLLDKVGVPVEKLGDGTAKLEGLSGI